jgi:Histidine kinase/Tetratricopeptide repeat
MPFLKNIVFFLLAMSIATVTIGQHPDFKRIDSLKRILQEKHGIERIDCINAIGEEYWWPLRTAPGIISGWANLALKEALPIHYNSGIATSTMLLGVAEILRGNFGIAEKYLRRSLIMFEAMHSDFGLGWGNVWLGQSLYSQDNFDEALACQKKSIYFLEKLGDWEGEGKVWAWTGMSYAVLGNYDSSFYYCSKSLYVRQKMSDHACVVLSYINMGNLYQAAGSFPDALDYFKQGVHYANIHHLKHFTVNWTYFELVGSIYRQINNPDSSYYFAWKSLQIDSTVQMDAISFGEGLLLKNQYDSALRVFLKPVDSFRRGNDKYDLMRVLLGASRAYLGKGNIKIALSYARETYSIAKNAKAKQFIIEDCQLLSKIYYQNHNYDSAYLFGQNYASLKDSITNRQFLWKLTNYKEHGDFKNKMDQLAILDSENKIKEEKLKQEATQKWILLACFLIAAFSGIIFYKNLSLKRKNEKLESRGKQADLQRHVTDLEMQALRAQMNPHFIFNCLSSINRFILKNETEAASGYLTKFSRLVRTVLTNSKRSFISLKDELEMLRLYLDMEKLRFKDAFDYSITYVNSIDDENVFVPPLLLQPFAENAIWHGLMHKEGPGKLEIELSIDEKVLACTITDDGIGREKAASIKNKSVKQQKSLGLQITKERLALLNDEFASETFFDFDDLVDTEGNSAGTRVTLKMNYKDFTEAFLEA